MILLGAACYFLVQCRFDPFLGFMEKCKCHPRFCAKQVDTAWDCADWYHAPEAKTYIRDGHEAS